MFCSNCGKQLPDDINFCTDCGTPINRQQIRANVQTDTVKQVTTPPKKKYTPIIIILVVVILACVSGLIWYRFGLATPDNTDDFDIVSSDNADITFSDNKEEVQNKQNEIDGDGKTDEVVGTADTDKITDDDGETDENVDTATTENTIDDDAKTNEVVNTTDKTDDSKDTVAGIDASDNTDIISSSTNSEEVQNKQDESADDDGEADETVDTAAADNDDDNAVPEDEFKIENTANTFPERIYRLMKEGYIGDGMSKDDISFLGTITCDEIFSSNYSAVKKILKSKGYTDYSGNDEGLNQFLYFWASEHSEPIATVRFLGSLSAYKIDYEHPISTTCRRNGHRSCNESGDPILIGFCEIYTHDSIETVLKKLGFANSEEIAREMKEFSEMRFSSSQALIDEIPYATTGYQYGTYLITSQDDGLFKIDVNAYYTGSYVYTDAEGQYYWKPTFEIILPGEGKIIYKVAFEFEDSYLVAAYCHCTTYTGSLWRYG